MEFENTAILLLSHGSKLSYGKEVISDLVNMYKKEYPSATVDYCFMEIRKPNIPEAVAKLTESGNIKKLIVVPVFIADGVHTKRDIPNILGLDVSQDDLDDIKAHEEQNANHEHHHHEHHHGHHHHHHDHGAEAIDFDGEVIFTEPLGADPLVYEIIKNRVSNAL